MKNALILIDYIYDFVADDGALTAGKPAQAIMQNIAVAISSLKQDDLLIIANDRHELNSEHPENKLFPPHAIADTKGRKNVMQSEIDACKARVIYLDKTRYVRSTLLLILFAR